MVGLELRDTLAVAVAVDDRGQLLARAEVETGSDPSAAAAAARDRVPSTGATRRAPAIAWLALNPLEREDYRKIGCLEAEVASVGIVRRLDWRIKAGDRSRVQDLVNGDLAAITLEQVLDGAREGDGVWVSVFRV